MPVVIPVYRGEHTLTPVLEELLPLTETQGTPGGRAWRLAEVVLVHDGGPDRSDVVIRRLSEVYSFVRPVWLSRNFSHTRQPWLACLQPALNGSPPLTRTGSLILRILVSCSTSHWTGMRIGIRAINQPPPHGRIRNFFSDLAKGTLTRLMTTRNLPRLIASA